MKIKPMMDYADSTVDALGVFYHEFIKYSGGDGSGLGIVLTPQHLTEFMCDLAGVNKNSRVVDICCGSGSFLVTAMSKMFQNANPAEIENIRKNGLYGVEFDDGLYTLAIANMIIRKDGKSNIYKGDCFNHQITDELKKQEYKHRINQSAILTERCCRAGVCRTFVRHSGGRRYRCSRCPNELRNRNKVQRYPGTVDEEAHITGCIFNA